MKKLILLVIALFCLVQVQGQQKSQNNKKKDSTTTTTEKPTITAQIVEPGGPGNLTDWYKDNDEDGYGAGLPYPSLYQPVGYVSNNTDCNDTCAACHPGAPEIADGKDNDCDGQIDEGLVGAAPSFSDENYFFSRTYLSELSSSSGIAGSSDVNEEIAYFDGLGRLIQKIGIQAGGNGEDIVNYQAYDGLGRQAKQYLPYASSSSSHGTYRSNALSETNSFYNTSKYGYTTNPYGESSYDGSPLNLIIKQGSPGNDWKIGNTSEHTVKRQYLAVLSSDDVRRFQANYSSSTSTASPNLDDKGTYPDYYTGYAPLLMKFVTKNENWVTTDGKNNTTETYKNFKGRTILKREFHTGNTLDTYYVYGPYGNLIYVLPPNISALSTISTLDIADGGYTYIYDNQNRMVNKREPGKDWEYIVYDPKNRPFMTQDGKLRGQGKWHYQKYDAFGRVIMTGLYTSTNDQAQMQSAVDDRYEYVSSAKAKEDKINSSTNNYYTNVSFPISNSEVLTLNYYDNYIFNTTSQGLLLSSGSSVLGSTVSYAVKGLLTGTRVKVLNQSTEKWITTVNHYDSKGNLIYSGSYNEFLSATTKTKNKYSFSKQIVETETTQIKGSTVVTTDNFTYDQANRLKKHTQTIGSRTEVIAENSYDNLGKLQSKGVGNTNSSGSRLQTIDYTYNVRGWLTQINNPSSLGSDLFALKLNYNSPTHGATPLFNGNIADAEWKTQSDNQLRYYKYGYDDLDRITTAMDNTTDYRYSLTSVSYDNNGNITHLNRNGQVGSSYGTMDNLTYSYYRNGNQLQRVNDSANDNFGFKDGSSTSNQYTYDSNGNMLRDYNKGISSDISYNFLNLPTSISLNGGTISYVYDAMGVKLQKTAGSTTTQYSGNYVYQNNVLQFFNTEEGYVEPIGSGSYDYVYQFKDQVGNIRLSYKDINQNNSSGVSLQILKENNYYPFGLEHLGYNSYNYSSNVALNYKFGGKELSADNNLELNTYDFGPRNYDPALGRWMGFDPLAAKDTQISRSPYAYSWNNPIKLADPSGMDPDYEQSEWRAGQAVTLYGGSFSVDEGGVSFSGSTTKSGGKASNSKSDHTIVKKNKDGTYTVIGGEKDNDCGVYVDNKDGEKIGETLAPDSYFDEDGKLVKYAKINLQSKTGQDFIDAIRSWHPSLTTYALNARNFHPLDFKSWGTNSNDLSYIRELAAYKGYSISYGGGKVIFTARDIGNFAAGLVARSNNLNWFITRTIFDGYQSMQSGKLTTEYSGTQIAEYAGFNSVN